MRLFWAIFLVCILKTQAHRQAFTPEWEEYVKQLHQLEEEYGAEIEESRNTRAIGTEYFNITFTSPPEAISVHSLRPENIDVVAALGDSITAGTGIDAEFLPGIGTQFRGLSWTIGGDEELNTSLTIPNILRKFNPAVKGHSVGTKSSFDILEQDWFNVAVPGARADDMVQQTEWLIDIMMADNRTSYENDWKLISIFIGGNDLCALGRDPDGASPETYRDHIRDTLDLMHQEIPRALVQIVQIMEIYLLPEVSSGFGAPPNCRAVQRVVCGHVVDSVEDETMLQELKEQNWRYQELIEELVGSGKYDTRDDFTVVIQPFFKDTRLPMTENGEIDATFFAPDCFHFSSKGHAMGALNVWNNMLEPEGMKSTEWDLNELFCPAEEHPYIFTRLNSGATTPTRNLKKREAPTFPKKAEVTCPELKCKSTPDWVVGVMSALAAAMVLQTLLILCALKRRGSGREILDGSQSSYSL